MSDSRVVLHGPRAPRTEKVGRGLRLKGLGFELVEPKGPADQARLSPETGLLPVLEVEGSPGRASDGMPIRLGATR